MKLFFVSFESKQGFLRFWSVDETNQAIQRCHLSLTFSRLKDKSLNLKKKLAKKKLPKIGRLIDNKKKYSAALSNKCSGEKSTSCLKW